MGKSLFVTGTGTDVGKTYVTGLLVKKLCEAGFSAGYYKAAISGAVPEALSDALYVKKVAALKTTDEKLVSYVYPEAVSPHLAARLNNRPIDMERLTEDFTAASEACEYLTVEGSGGIICPLRWDEKEKWGLAELIKKLNLAVLIVAPAGLGTINATLLTVHYLNSQQIPIKGIILNRFHPGDIMEEDNRAMIEAMSGVPVIAMVQVGETELPVSADFLAGLYS
ncbi:MAG: dethiobiotin synthase [Selenomonadaceae bacterium]|nr:dethiobiotin synthase [Selenomonadaceae bacterium]